jgi:MraZ protein
MFKVRCQVHATLDAKGRLALPAPLRRALEDARVASLVLTFSHGAVWGWDPPTFEETVEKPLLKTDPFASSVMDFAHAMLAPAQDVEVDGQGRIRVPQPLREMARLDKDVVVNSMLDRIEIWDRVTWVERFQSALARSSELKGMPGRNP